MTRIIRRLARWLRGRPTHPCLRPQPRGYWHPCRGWLVAPRWGLCWGLWGPNPLPWDEPWGVFTPRITPGMRAYWYEKN